MARDLTPAEKSQIVAWMKRIAEDLRLENDRSIVIVGAAQADSCLYRALERFLVPSASKTENPFEGYSPLSSFSSKIMMSYRLGLIDEEFTKALNKLRKLRNSCAHDAATVTLDAGGHKDQVLALALPLARVSDWWHHFRSMVGFTGDTSSDLFRAVVVYMLVRLESMSRRVSVLNFDEPYGYVAEEWQSLKFEDRSSWGDSDPAPKTA